MLMHLLSFAAGAGIVYVWLTLRRTTAPQPGAERASSGTLSPMRASAPSDEELEARIIEYLSSNVVYHINDLCQSLEHPKGARYVRSHFHKLMEQGKIRYRDMVYTV